MDRDIVKGKAKQVEGRVQNVVGAIKDDPIEQIAGKTKQAAGKVQEEFGRVKDDVRRKERRSGEA